MTQDELDALPVVNGMRHITDERGHTTLVRDTPVFLIREGEPLFAADREGRLWSIGRDITGRRCKERNWAAEAAFIAA